MKNLDFITDAARTQSVFAVEALAFALDGFITVASCWSDLAAIGMKMQADVIGIALSASDAGAVFDSAHLLD